METLVKSAMVMDINQGFSSLIEHEVSQPKIPSSSKKPKFPKILELLNVTGSPTSL